MKKMMQFAKELKVLYVEDNEEARQSTLGLLENFFDHITVAINGEDGLEKFQSDKFDLILSDINMPKMNGIEMITKIRELDKDIAILILSAYNESGYFIETIKQGVEGYLLKPIELKQFVDMIKKAIEKIYLKYEVVSHQTNLEQKVQEQTQELRDQLCFDRLTSLENKQVLFKTIEEDNPTGLMLIDINNFSAINDVYGFEIGDKVLQNISKLLIDVAKDQYRVFRVDGNQFAFLDMNNNLNDTSVHNIISDIENSTIGTNENVANFNITLTASIVLSNQITDLFKEAQAALFHAKKTNQYLIFYYDELNLEQKHKKELDAIVMVKNALEEDRLVPVFQLIEKYQEYKTYECLVRIKQDGKLISPFFFLDAVKRTKYYTELTKTMIKKSFDKFRGTTSNFSINLSFEDITNSSLITFLEDTITQSNMANQVILEILENESIDNFKLVKDFTSKMQGLGVRISIDDFGSGYSNFTNVLELNPDIIKVDGSLIKNICEDEKSFLVTKTIINFAKELGADTVVEFVYNKEVLKKVKQLSPTGYQGYYLAEPLEVI